MYHLVPIGRQQADRKPAVLTDLHCNRGRPHFALLSMEVFPETSSLKLEGSRLILVS